MTRTAQLVKISEGKEYTYTLDPPFDDVTRVRIHAVVGSTKIFDDTTGRRIICYDQPFGGYVGPTDGLQAWGNYTETPLSIVQRGFGVMSAEQPPADLSGPYRYSWSTFSEETRIVLTHYHTENKKQEQAYQITIAKLKEELATKLTRGVDAAAIAERVRHMIEYMVDGGTGDIDEDEEGDYDDA